MVSAKAARSTGRISLKGKWTQSIAVGFVAVSAGFVLNLLEVALRMFLQPAINTLHFPLLWVEHFRPVELIVDALSFLFFLFIFLPLLLGCLRWFWRMTAGANDSVGTVFYYFSTPQDYFESIALFARLTVRFLLTILVLFSPAFILKLLMTPQFSQLVGLSETVNNVTFTPLYSILCIIAFVVTVLTLSRLFLAPVIMVDNDGITAKKSIKMSSIMTTGLVGAFWGFVFSFIGWFLLCLLAVPAILIIPYFIASFAVFSRYCIFEYKRKTSLPQL